MEEYQDGIDTIIGSKIYRKILQIKEILMYYKFDKHDGHGEIDHPSILDIGIILNQLSKGRGFMIEGLGFMSEAFGTPYSAKKEAQLVQYIKDGFCPLFIPYDDPQTKNFYFNRDKYNNFMDNVQNIGFVAPLLARSQFKQLIHAMAVSGLSFSETLRVLGSKYDEFGFVSKENAIEIQKAFGLNVNEGGIVVDSSGTPIASIINADSTINAQAMASEKNMFDWWQN